MPSVHTKVAFSGKMTAGKTTIANILEKEYGYVALPIGGRIKKVCNLLIEDRNELITYLNQILPERTLKNEENAVQVTYNALDELFNNNFIKFLISTGVNNVFVKESTGVYQKNEYYRSLTQKVGSKIREIFGEQIWCQICLNEANHLVDKGKKVICDDIRLDVENKMLTEQGYTLIRFDVEPEEQKKRILKLYKTYNEDALIHPTETELDTFKFENRLDTTFDTVEETYEKVKKIIKG
ncbi:hypothetical protein MZM54_02350 [[Brevibacterium] frigoritolerans]|nr:hypothetical protein [Peribacillus frigoritolerans]